MKAARISPSNCAASYTQDEERASNVSLLFAEERELGLGFRELVKSFSLAFVDQLIECFECFPSQISFLFREVRT